MSLHVEIAAASAVGLNIANPDDLEEYEIPLTDSAVLISYDELFIIAGTPDELVQFGVRFIRQASRLIDGPNLSALVLGLSAALKVYELEVDASVPPGPADAVVTAAQALVNALTKGA